MARLWDGGSTTAKGTHNLIATPAQTWAAAVTGSLSAHALAFWMLGELENGTPAPRSLSPILDVYLMPPPAPDRLEPDRPRAPPPDVERPRAEPSESSDASEPAARERPRARIDWNSEIAKAVARIRETTPQYRSFGYPAAPDGAPGSTASSDGDRGPGERGLTETMPWGERRISLNEDCYQTAYEPGSVLAEAHRFSNAFVICSPSGPAEPRNDLFIESKPAYLR